MSTVLRCALGLLLAVILGGCSTIKIAYNNADDLLAWMADDYFDLSRDQADGLKQMLVRFHAWHRASQLPEYARLLDEADRRLAAGLGAADVAWATQTYQARYQLLANRAHADAARLLATLSDEQIAHLRRKLDEANRKWTKEHGAGQPAQEQRRLRAKRLLDRIEHWTGSLASAQSARLTELSHEMPLLTEAALKYRLRRQKEFLALLEQRHDAEALSVRLKAWLLEWDYRRAPELAADYARFAEARARLYVEGYKLLNAEQRDHVSSRLRRYGQAFRELAEERPRASTLAAQP